MGGHTRQERPGAVAAKPARQKRCAERAPAARSGRPTADGAEPAAAPSTSSASSLPVARQRPHQRGGRPRHRPPGRPRSRPPTGAAPRRCRRRADARRGLGLHGTRARSARAAAPQERRARRQRMDRRADVVAVAGQRQLGGAGASADRRAARSSTQHRAPCPRELDRRRQPVRAGADDDRVVPCIQPLASERLRAIRRTGAPVMCIPERIPALCHTLRRLRPLPASSTHTAWAVTSASAPRCSARAGAACASSARPPSCGRPSPCRPRTAGRRRASAPVPGRT